MKRQWMTRIGLTGALAAILLSTSTHGAYSATETAKSSDSFVDSIGINTHLSYEDTSYGNFSNVKSKLTELGVRHIRDHAHLRNDQWFNNSNYAEYKDLAQSGIRSNLIVDPRFQNLGTVNEEKIASIARMAGPAIESFEGPNEYDLSGNAQWATTLRDYQGSLYRAVKNNPSTSNVPVLGPSMAMPNNSGTLGDLSNALDYGNMHSYPGGARPSLGGLTDYYLPGAKKISGSKPLIASETGYHNALEWTKDHPSVSETAAGKYMPRLYLEYFNRGFERTYGYELFDQYPDPDNNEREKNFGLLRHDGTKKPAYTALDNLIGLLEDPGAEFQPKSLDYSLSGETTDLHHTLLQKRDGRFYLILWLEKQSFNGLTKQDMSVPSQTVSLTLNTSIGKAQTFLPNQSINPTKSYTAPTKLSLQVPDHPLVVELTPSTQATTGNKPPKVERVRPGSGARINDSTPTMTANVTDAEMPLQKTDITLLLDGRSINQFSYDQATGELRVTPDRKLKRGADHRFTIIAKDQDEQTTERAVFRVTR